MHSLSQQILNLDLESKIKNLKDSISHLPNKVNRARSKASASSNRRKHCKSITNDSQLEETKVSSMAGQTLNRIRVSIPDNTFEQKRENMSPMGSPRSIQIMNTYGDEVDEAINVLNDEFNKIASFQRTQ